MKLDFVDKAPDYLIFYIRHSLEYYEKLYKDKSWFDNALKHYKEHVKETEPDEIRMPGYVFEKYIKRYEKENKNGRKN